jgi:Meckelin (Transmembrane protein 67)
VLCVLGNAARCTGLALTAVALVLSIHAFVLFKGQKDSFLYVIPNAALQDLRLAIILAAVFLGWSVLWTIYCQTRLTDVAMIDWERPQQVCRI